MFTLNQQEIEALFQVVNEKEAIPDPIIVAHNYFMKYTMMGDPSALSEFGAYIKEYLKTPRETYQDYGTPQKERRGKERLLRDALKVAVESVRQGNRENFLSFINETFQSVGLDPMQSGAVV